MTSTPKFTVAFATFVLAAPTLLGCTATADAGATTESPQSPAASTAQAVPQSSPTGDVSDCRWPAGETGALVGEPLDVEQYENVADMGPADGARGTVTYDDDGIVARYITAEGDSFAEVAARVCTTVYGLQALNAVRRGFGPEATQLYAGDIINLSPYTITSVGDQNGETKSLAPSFVLPPQH